jgi:ribonuclease P protein component
MRRSSDFGAAVRRGRRAGSRTLVVHVLPPTEADRPTVVGFVVSKAVGGAVVRNRTKRRLRSLIRSLLPQIVPGSHVVVRAQPPSGGVPAAALGQDLSRALQRAGALTAQERPA